jgi:hypothetical protein
MLARATLLQKLVPSVERYFAPIYQYQWQRVIASGYNPCEWDNAIKNKINIYFIDPEHHELVYSYSGTNMDVAEMNNDIFVCAGVVPSVISEGAEIIPTIDGTLRSRTSLYQKVYSIEPSRVLALRNGACIACSKLTGPTWVGRIYLDTITHLE